MMCIRYITPSQLHCSPPLPFVATLILRFEHSSLELEPKLWSLPHPFSTYSLSLPPSYLRKMLLANSDALWARRGGKESIALVRKSSEGEVQCWIRASQMHCGRKQRSQVNNFCSTSCEVSRRKSQFFPKYQDWWCNIWIKG